MTHRLPLKRALAALLLPASLLPVLLGAPSLARAPATLALRAERPIARALAPAKTHRAPPEPGRYPIGAARLEVDVFQPVAGDFTPQVGVSPLAEHRSAAEVAANERRLAAEVAAKPPLLITPGQEAGSRP